MIISLWLITFTAIGLSYKHDIKKTNLALNKSFKSFLRLLPALALMIIIVGSVLYFFPRDRILVLFEEKGFLGLMLVSIVGAILTIPGPIAFPLAGELASMGVSGAQLASFITTLTMVGFATAPAEAAFFGRRFVIIRQVLSLIAAIIIRFIMGEIL